MGPPDSNGATKDRELGTTRSGHLGPPDFNGATKSGRLWPPDLHTWGLHGAGHLGSPDFNGATKEGHSVPPDPDIYGHQGWTLGATRLQWGHQTWTLMATKDRHLGPLDSNGATRPGHLWPPRRDIWGHWTLIGPPRTLTLGATRPGHLWPPRTDLWGHWTLMGPPDPDIYGHQGGTFGATFQSRYLLAVPGPEAAVPQLVAL